MTEYGMTIRRLRKAKDLTMGDIADACGFTSVAYVSDVERGRRGAFPKEYHLTLAKLLGVEVNMLDELAAATKRICIDPWPMMSPTAAVFLDGLSNGDGSRYSHLFWVKVRAAAVEDLCSRDGKKGDGHG